MRLGKTHDAIQDRIAEFTFIWNGQEIRAYEGETILGALMASEPQALRKTRFQGEPRNMLCGMGICYECLVTVDGMPNRRACVTPARANMVVSSGGTVNLNEAE